jgi:hypothetical protein
MSSEFISQILAIILCCFLCLLELRQVSSQGRCAYYTLFGASHCRLVSRFLGILIDAQLFMYLFDSLMKLHSTCFVVCVTFAIYDVFFMVNSILQFIHSVCVTFTIYDGFFIVNSILQFIQSVCILCRNSHGA